MSDYSTSFSTSTTSCCSNGSFSSKKSFWAKSFYTNYTDTNIQLLGIVIPIYNTLIIFALELPKAPTGKMCQEVIL